MLKTFKKRITLSLGLIHLSMMFHAQVIPTTISLNPSQAHTFTLEKTNMTLNPLFSGQNYGSELYYYNGGVGSNYNFLIDYYRYKFTHTGITNSDITNVTYSFNYAAHDDINHPTQPAWWGQSKFSIIVPPSSCNANYWGSYSLNDCLSTENCINNGGSLLAYIGPNGNGSGTTLTQSQSLTGGTLSSLLLDPNDFTIAFQPDGGVTCRVDLKSTISVQLTYNTYPIANNILSGNQSYIGSANPTIISGTTPTGGNKNIFTYQWQSSLNNSTWTNISGATTASYDPPLINQTTYYRRISYSAPQPASTSNVITVTITVPIPPTPLNFSVDAYGSLNSLYLAWSASAGATSYDIFSCSGTFIANVIAPSTGYIVTGLAPGNIYNYKVVAKNASGSSLPTSCVASGTTLNDVTGLTFNTNCDHLTLSWNSVYGATYYDVVNCSYLGGIVVLSTTSTSCLIAVTPGSSILYRVDAHSNYANSIGASCASYNVPVTTVLGGVATSSSSQLCPGISSSLLNLTGYFGSIQWQSSICSAPFQDVAGATSSSYNVTSADGTGTSFRAKVVCGSTIAYSNTKKVSQYNVCNPGIRNIPACDIGGGGTARNANTNNNSSTNLFDQINVYPNPATNELSVELISLEGSDIGISIYDLLGKIVYNSNEKNASTPFKQTIDVSEFNRGIYYVKINDNINTYYNKLILR